MSDTQTNELWRRFKQEGDLSAREEIILTYTYLAKYVVGRLLVRPNSVLSMDDLIGHAAVGLIDAVDRFDPSKGIKFETYAVIRIKGSVLDALKSIDWIPRSTRATDKQIKQTYASLEAALNRPATDEEVANALGMDIDTLNTVLADVGQSIVISMEDLLTYGEDSHNFEDGLPTDTSLSPLAAAESSIRKQLLAQAIDDLPEKEKFVIGLYYGDGLTLREIAEVLGVTESRVCQLHSKAAARLHGKLARHADLLLAAA